MPFIKAFGFIFCFTLTQAASALTLNGIASYEHLRKEFYIAALYLIEPSHQPDTILANNQSKRMAIKVTTKRWTPRRWSRMWQNDIAINNRFASDDELTHQLMMFTGFLQEPLTAGDEIMIEYLAPKGTSISINNIKIMQTANDQLFNYLLNVWIGKLPPSGEFKRRILTASNDPHSQDLKRRFNGINYTNARSQLISSWIRTRQEAKLAALKAQSDALAKALAQQEQATALKLALEKQARQATKKVVVAKPKLVKTYITPKKTIKKKKLTKQKKIASVKVVSKTTSKTQIDAQDRYYLDLYRWELRREIRSAIRYPPWAQRFGQKGVVAMTFTVNRQAQVSKLIHEDNPPELLVNEVQNAIEGVVPFILPPDALSGNEWSFSFSYKFDPKDSAQPYLKKPRKPASLASIGKITRSQYNRILSQYIDDIKAAIDGRIEYPVWSKKLKHKGMVEIEIKINREGLVTSNKEIKLSRHEALNQEVRNAIEQSQPLPPIPDVLKLNFARLKIKHKFK